MVFEEFALKLIVDLLKTAIKEGIKYSTLNYFTRRKIESRVEDATAEVVEPLIPFLTHEHISEEKQRRLIETCVAELRPLTNNPELLFQGSLNGQKIFENLYAHRDLPDVIVEDGLKNMYTLICPRIAELLCKIPAAVKDWESEAWSENFRRFDEIAAQLRTLFLRVDQLATAPSRKADETLTRVRQALAQKIGFDLDLTGLRADRPQSGKFDDFFVHPEIKEITEDKKREPVSVGTPEESFKLFTRARHQAIIVGAPGAGKSTWSKWLQREALSPRWTGIAVRVELRGFSGDSLPSLHELIREAAGKHFAEELTAERISSWLDGKQIIFILDGFDEIRPTERDSVYDWIVDLKTAARGCPFILTSRSLTTNHLERLQKGWSRWNIEPFDESRIVDYIERWYQFTPLIPDTQREVNAGALAATWRGDPTIGHLTGNPLLLSTLLMVHHLDGSLPSGRSQLYRRYVEGMLGLWDDRRKVTATIVTLSLEQKRQILRGLALHLFLNGLEQIDETDALAWLESQLQKMKISFLAEDVLAVLRERSGLIIGPGIYSFAHKSIAEYLVAETIVQGDQRDESGRRLDRFSLFEHRDDDRWNTVTFLWAGLAPIADVESFIDACIDAESFELGAGIILDQYKRIPTEIRRRLLLNIIQMGESLPLETLGIWNMSCPKKSNVDAVDISFILRSLTPHVEFGSLVNLAIQDEILSWSDASKTTDEIKQLLWKEFILRPIDLEQWKVTLKETPFEGEAQMIWLLWAIRNIIHRILSGWVEHDIKSILKVYNEALPHLCGLMPIMLISTGYDMGVAFSEESLRQRLKPILKSLPESDDGEIMGEWLLATSEWELLREAKSNDLLREFLQLISHLKEEGVIEADETYENAVRYVEGLIRQRDALKA